MAKKLFSILYIFIKLFSECYIMNKINISLGITAVATLAMFFLPNLVSANAQNATISIDVDSIKPHLCFLIINFSKQIVSHIQVEPFCSKICGYFIFKIGKG